MSSAVVKKIETILHTPYHIKNYVDLVREIFPDVRIVAPEKLNKEFSNFSSHIEGSAHVGTFQTPDKKKIIIMAVQLKKAGYVENSRSTHRSFAKKLIENGNADAAFIAFYTEDDPKWRLSLVRLDYEMKIENGRLKTAENLTPAKRYSYLVGQDEPCHTAISQFERFITDSAANPEHPTLDDLENAFSVEKVTDEFFNLYCEKFHQLREQLEAIEDFRIEAEQHNFTSAQFAKKLMGQIVFLYFLQKKGWLGVGAWPNTLTEKEYKNAFYARGAKSRELIPIVYRPVGDGTYKISGAGLNSISDADEEVLANCVKGKPWGSGPHDFMRKLFNIAVQRNVNFYNELLEPLFYDALNRNRGEQGYCPALHCRIPFLSGGLFEPIDGYDWEHNDFSIPNEVFSNVDTKGREADGILDIFDRYNFTMSEDEPMEREVAIDPEMLGKVFENLLEINDRKSKGAFYTPREIVHYMCQESLINYLTNALNISENAIRDFILYGDFLKDEDTVKEKRQGNGGMYISEELYKINPDGTVAVNRLLDMDKALKDVRVADPAVGSGAFPLGMLNEIVRARQNISAYLAITMKPYDVRMMYQMERSPHTLKYETIRNCIFACDIEPSAVDIAQLRLWLALVIDDEINPNAQTPLDGHRNPLPLPNLESNILCGNSLVDEFEDIRLVKESDLLGSSGSYQRDITSDQFDSIVRKLIETQDELFRCDNTDKKKQLKEQIESLRDMIIHTQLEGCDSAKIQRYCETKQMASKPYVLWQLDFARVFREKSGFDIVIGNPPYVSTKGQSAQDKKVLSKIYGYADDLYYHFISKAFRLLRTDGVFAYITPDTYFTTLTKKGLRDEILQHQIIKLVQLGHDIFESAMVSTSIIVAQNCTPIENFVVECIDVKNKDSISLGDRYLCSQKIFESSINGAFYMPTEFNRLLCENLGDQHSSMLRTIFPLVATSRDITKNARKISQYIDGLKPSDWTLIGMVTEGGVGLQTGNNGKYIGYREGTREAERAKVTRLEKLAAFNAQYRCSYEMPVDESDVWELFEQIKDKYDRDVFGQGYLYKVVPESMIADLSSITENERANGISGRPSFVPYDKGDKEGNRWYNVTPYLIDWSAENVAALKAVAGKKERGSSRFQNSQFYFREGFSYSDIKTFFLKSRMKGVSIHDVKSMSLFPVTEKIPYYYIVTLLNTEVIATFVYNFLNNTPSFQINDCRMLPIPVPTETQLADCWSMFSKAVEIQEKYFAGSLESYERDVLLDPIQNEIEKWACELYGIPVDFLKGSQNYVR